MAGKRRKKKKSAADLSTENELMKLKMMAEFGGNFVGSDDIPPAMENQFLRQIINFHKHHDRAKVTTVYKYIGEPEYNHVNDLSDREVGKELKRLNKLMLKNGVALSVLAETPKRDVYRFITEELFKHEVEELRLKGWVNQFIYEEFHPNADYDIRNAIHYAVQYMFEKKAGSLEEYFSEEMKDSLGLSLDVEEFYEKIAQFKERFYDVKFKDCKLPRVKIDTGGGGATVKCQVNYKFKMAKGQRFKTESAFLEFRLEKSSIMDSWWEINQVISDLF